MILIIPSIDLVEGKCARLVQGMPGTQTIYSDDPVETAILWRGENAKMLHVADLDGAVKGEMKNLNIIREIIEAVEIPIQVSGGVRTYDQVKQVLEAGAARVVVASEAAKESDLIEKLLSDFGPRRIVAAVDAKTATPRSQPIGEPPQEATILLGMKLKSVGLERALFADSTRDGTLSGPIFDAIREFAQRTKLKVTASGGVSGYPDLRKMQELEPYGVDSVVIGRALYENKFPCQELWRKCEIELTDLGPTRRV